jgi:hypothetical protein
MSVPDFVQEMKVGASFTYPVGGRVVEGVLLQIRRTSTLAM